MCGFTGFFPFQEQALDICRRMTDAIAHRGPDDSGIWADRNKQVVFGHRRLSIHDLSQHGHQPMASASGRYVIAFNGEIYNFNVLRKELSRSGFHFKGHSDTEVLLAALENWGIRTTLDKIVGMFAFALWDEDKSTITLARDRLGEKPLYYGRAGKSFIFGSELKALKMHPEWENDISRDALTLQMRHSYIPAPYSIFKSIHKLPPGTYLEINVHKLHDLPSPVAYWSAKEQTEIGSRESFHLSDDEAINGLESILLDTIEEKMISDVPLGAFLSGGIDSSTVVALMQKRSSSKIKTFSIGFEEESHNEAQYAAKIASHLDTDHTELYVNHDHALSVIPKLPSLYDEPFSDPSQIPTYLVSEMTRQHVTVALSGDGGDELFGGYQRYLLAQTLSKVLNNTPQFIRTVGTKSIIGISPAVWDHLGKYLGIVYPALRKKTGDKLHKLATILSSKNQQDLYKNLVSHWKQPTELVINSTEPPTRLTDFSGLEGIENFIQIMMYLDSVSYLPDDILAKVDRASMGVSLETRLPFLDHRIYEFSTRIPLNQKIREGKSKWILRQVLEKHVPKSLFDRPKMGFGVPIHNWLRGPLRDWAESLLSEQRLKDEGYFDSEIVRTYWSEHISGARNWQHYLWDILMFQAWREQNA